MAVKWALASFMVAFGVMAILSIGLPFLVVGVAATGVLASRGQLRDAPLGIGVGLLAAMAFLAVRGFADAMAFMALVSLSWTLLAMAVGMLLRGVAGLRALIRH